jgi:uncharacterized RDD family membrane protein YckC
MSAGLGFVALALCGIPFVPPASTVAIVLGIAGCLSAVASVVSAFLCGRPVNVTILVIGIRLVALNGFAISLGQLGKHLIDCLEAH